MSLLTIIHQVLCGVILWGVFCRFTKTSRTTKLSIRLVFWYVGIVACASLAMPIVYDYEPRAANVLMLSAFAIVQVVTAAHWGEGVPYKFIKPRFRIERRNPSTRKE